MSYLTESKLESILRSIYSRTDFIKNKTVPGSNIRNRPDYRNDKLKLIVEFDGYLHYSSSKTIIADKIKDETYSKMEYNIIRIPYFIQLNKQITKLLFNKILKLKIKQYPHGFIDDKALLPSDFCELGIKRFKKDLCRFNIVKNDIIESLKHKISKLENIDLVLPPSLYKLIK